MSVRPSDLMPPRSQWGRLLSKLPPDRVMGVAERLIAGGGWSLDRITREGLRLLPLRESTRGEDFYLGEVPLVEVRLMLQNEAGNCLEGGAVLLDAPEDLVEAVAVLDALLAAEAPGTEEIIRLLAEGEGLCGRVEQERAHMRLRTRVNFSLLSDVDSGEPI